MADKLLALSTFIVLTVPGLGLANPLPIWLTVIIISRDVVIVRTVAIVNLAIGPRTFRPSMFGKVATATYMMTAVVAMFYNYRGYHSVVVDVFVYASLAITLISSLHYISPCGAHHRRTLSMHHAKCHEERRNRRVRREFDASRCVRVRRHELWFVGIRSP